jgi:aspartate racemase
MKSKKRIGMLGGLSHESTTKYYNLIHKKYFQEFGDYYSPEIIIFSMDFQKFTNNENSGNEKNHVAYMVEGTKALEKAGVDFAIITANSPHAFFEQIKKQIEIPMISIAGVTERKAKSRGMKKLLLTGIKFTMQSDFYPSMCKKDGIEVITSSDSEQDEIDSIIFGELCVGECSDSLKKKLLKVINKYDVDGVILGCTELPLILKDGDGNVPFLNTVEIHVEATLRKALSGE